MDKFYSILEKYKHSLLSEDENTSPIDVEESPESSSEINDPPQNQDGLQIWDDGQSNIFIDKTNNGNYAGALGTAIYDPTLESILNPAIMQTTIKEPLDNMIASMGNSVGGAVGFNNESITNNPSEDIAPDLVPDTQLNQDISKDPNTQQEQPVSDEIKLSLSPILGGVRNTIKKITDVFSDKNIAQLAANLKELSIKHPLEFKNLNDIASQSDWRGEITNLANEISSNKAPIQSENFDRILNDYIVLNEMALGKAILKSFLKGTTVGKNLKRITTAADAAKKIKTLKDSLHAAYASAKLSSDAVKAAKLTFATAARNLKAAERTVAAATPGAKPAAEAARVAAEVELRRSKAFMRSEMAKHLTDLKR